MSIPDNIGKPIEQRHRIVYGFRCTWWDSIIAAGKSPDNDLPCCPHCGSVLLESTESMWLANIQAWSRENHDPDYVNLINWMRGKCFPDIDKAKEAWKGSKERSPG